MLDYSIGTSASIDKTVPQTDVPHSPQVRCYLKKPVVIDRVDKIDGVNPKEKPVKMLMSLLRSALCDEKADVSALKGANYSDWVTLVDLSNNANLTGIVVDSLGKFPENPVPTDVSVDMLEFTKEMEEKYAKQENILGALTERFGKKDIDIVQLKGVGFSMNYPVPQHRYGGDIDIFTRLKNTITNDHSNSSDIVDNDMVADGIHVDDYAQPKVKHSEFEYDGVRIENHRFFCNKTRLPEAYKIDEYLHKHLNPKTQILPNGTKILVPSKEFNTLFMAQHAFQHFVFGGIDLHHLTDWAMHIKANGLEVPDVVKGTHLEDFMYAFTNVSNKYLGTNVKVPENPEYENLLFETMINVHDDVIPEKLNGFEVALYKTKRLWKRAKHANKYGGGGYFMIFRDAFIHKLHDPAQIFKR